eukprot:11171952-Lingulodinium_polyedra.AAC.1
MGRTLKDAPPHQRPHERYAHAAVHAQDLVTEKPGGIPPLQSDRNVGIGDGDLLKRTECRGRRR